MQTHILSLHTHSTPGMRSKVNIFFLKVAMLDIKLKGMEHSVPCKHIFCPYTHSQPVGWTKRLEKSECGHVAYQIKGKERSID